MLPCNEKDLLFNKLIEFTDYIKQNNNSIFSIEIVDDYRSIEDNNEHLQNAECNGAYIFYTNREIIYIGMGDQTNGGGIGRRVLSHYKIKDYSVRYRWNIDFLENEKQQELVKYGFNVATIKVEPTYYSSLIETYLLTAYRDKYNKLPIFNCKY
jgi:hypothetical protein